MSESKPKDSLLSGIADRRLPKIKRSAQEWNWAEVVSDPVLEVGLIVLWAIWVGRAYLDLDPTVWPIGGDFPLSIHAYYVWTLLTKCGTCFLWNGFMNGGVPAIVDLVGAVLHPIPSAASILWGAINGAKITIIASLAMAGIAQWWIARVLQLGPLPRLWGAGMAVAGGHLAGPMAGGLVGMPLSIAAVSLVIAPGLKLALTGRRRTAIWLGITLALAFMAGQGYSQIGLIFAVLPAFVIFLFDEKLRIRPLWREFVLAGVLAVLLTAVLWVPVLHFWPHYSKPFDASFSSSQPIKYSPLNLVIDDVGFFRSEALGKKPLPSFYMSYIGWGPVLFALLAIRLVPRSSRRQLAFFGVAIFLIYLTSSAVVFKFLVKYLQGFSAIRFPSLISNLTVPFVLGLAAWGMDQLLQLEWPKFTVTLTSETSLTFAASWLILTVPLAWGLKSTYEFGRHTLRTHRVRADYHEIVDAIETDSVQWVKFPEDDFTFTPVALDADLKVTNAYRSFTWKDREPPPPFIDVVRNPVDTSSPNFLRKVSGLNLVAHPENEYAFVDTKSGQIACQATAQGGNISVDCQTDEPGTLTVREYKWSSWKAKRDGNPIPLGSGQWLNVEMPAGKHHFEFHYRPWDALLGGILTLIGVFLAVWLWVHPTSLDLDEETVTVEI